VSTNEPCEAFDSYAATEVVDGQEIVLGLWEVRDINDTPRSLEYSQMDVFILCFSLDDPSGFENVRSKACRVHLSPT
jgi:Ras-related C3 botulinum toxin substrate 1